MSVTYGYALSGKIKTDKRFVRMKVRADAYVLKIRPKEDMSARKEIEAVIDTWNKGLDGGDIEAMVSTCHPDTMTVNERQPTTIGTQAIRDKYNPRIEAAEITSGYDIEDLHFFGDVAVVSGRFYGTMKMRETGEVRNPEGRLVLVYQKDENGAWKMILDMDNNGPFRRVLSESERQCRERP